MLAELNQARVDARAAQITQQCREMLTRGKAVAFHNAPHPAIERGPADVAARAEGYDYLQEALFTASPVKAGELINLAVRSAVESILDELADEICAAAEKQEGLA